MSSYQPRNEGYTPNDLPKLFCDILINPPTPVTLPHEKFPDY